MEVNGSGAPAMTATSMTTISEKLHESRYTINFWMLSNTRRPSSTAATMVAKLSSSNTTSAACLASSVPATPIATPTSAVRSAGASLTPSPVIATCSLRS